MITKSTNLDSVKVAENGAATQKDFSTPSESSYHSANGFAAAGDVVHSKIVTKGVNVSTYCNGNFGVGGQQNLKLARDRPAKPAACTGYCSAAKKCDNNRKNWLTSAFGFLGRGKAKDPNDGGKSPPTLCYCPETSTSCSEGSVAETNIHTERNCGSIDEKKPERGHWSGRADFLMSLVAYAVGLGNVWRFPYLCFKNGGGAFLIPYFTCWFVAAVPIFFMEVSIGQFLGEGGISVWKLCPIFRGVGIANTLIAIYCNIYFPVIVAWATFYVISSFTTSNGLPWQTCERSWNDPFCFDTHDQSKNLSDWLNKTGLNFSDAQSPVTQFWEKRVLQTSSNIEQTSMVQWELLGLLAFIWMLTYFALYKGITNSTKLVYACAITPYILLVILLIRGLTLEGAWTGIKYYLKPNPSMLLKAEVWKDAGTQIFYSTGIGFGTLVALGSYNRYNHNVFRDSIALSLINSMTSLMAGFVVFSVLGYMAQEAGKSIEQVVKSGVGLAFLVYPEAIATMPVSKLWSVLFFLMIMILGLDSLVCMVEGVVLAISDQFPHTLRKNKKMFLASLCVVGFLLGIPMVCDSGQFWLTLIDSYGASGISLLFVVFFEIIALSWFFGTKNIYRALEDMLKYRPSNCWKFCWKYTAPFVCVVIFAITIYDYSPLVYPDNVSHYPSWTMAIGFVVSATSILSIPVYALYYLCTTPGTLKQRFSRGIVPCIKLRFESTNLPTSIPMRSSSEMSTSGYNSDRVMRKESSQLGN